MNNTTIQARVLLDTSAYRKVIVIPNRIDLPLGKHHIEWTLGDGVQLKFTDFKIASRNKKCHEYKVSDDRITMDIVNDFHDDDVDLAYAISLLRGDTRYSTEPHDQYDDDDCDDEYDDKSVLMAHQPMFRSGPIIRNHPV